MRRLGVLVCATAALCASCVGGGSSAQLHHASSSPEWLSTTGWRVTHVGTVLGAGAAYTVRYPPGWHVYAPQGLMPAQFVFPVGSISSAREHVSCQHSTDGDATKYWCDPPRPKLRPAGVLTEWMWVSPDVEHASSPAFRGSLIRIGGWRASLRVEPPDCGNVGATQMVDVHVFSTLHPHV